MRKWSYLFRKLVDIDLDLDEKLGKVKCAALHVVGVVDPDASVSLTWSDERYGISGCKFGRPLCILLPLPYGDLKDRNVPVSKV